MDCSATHSLGTHMQQAIRVEHTAAGVVAQLYRCHFSYQLPFTNVELTNHFFLVYSVTQPGAAGAPDALAMPANGADDAEDSSSDSDAQQNVMDAQYCCCSYFRFVAIRNVSFFFPPRAGATSSNQLAAAKTLDRKEMVCLSCSRLCLS